jgi:photosystem II stability/assembly factor-like uncharacterized protein
MSIRRPSLLVLILLGCSNPPVEDDSPPRWEKLETEPAQDKQDDICFVDPDTGWYVNSIGKIFKTADGGRSWKSLVHKQGTYWRSILFLDARRGFAGNLGPGALEGFRSVMATGDFENLNREVRIEDPTLIYETTDGGRTWTPAPGVPAGPGGICSLSSLEAPDRRDIVYAVGRVTGPSCLFRKPPGDPWETIELPKSCGMGLDVKFLDPRTGILCSATDRDPAVSRASIFRTEDGGRTWNEVYRSARPGESVWKCSFPTLEVGYATIRSFVPDPKAALRYVLKTEDGGRTWREIILTEDLDSRPQGVAFLTPEHGWVGTTSGGFETVNGGETWMRADLGRSINRIRIVPSAGGGVVIYAIGRDLCRLRLR